MPAVDSMFEPCVGDGDLLAREGVARDPRGCPGVEVVALVGDAGALREAVERARPDVVVADTRVRHRVAVEVSRSPRCSTRATPGRPARAQRRQRSRTRPRALSKRCDRSRLPAQAPRGRRRRARGRGVRDRARRHARRPARHRGRRRRADARRALAAALAHSPASGPRSSDSRAVRTTGRSRASSASPVGRSSTRSGRSSRSSSSATTLTRADASRPHCCSSRTTISLNADGDRVPTQGRERGQRRIRPVPAMARIRSELRGRCGTRARHRRRGRDGSVRH